jgi:allophanate hydrolase subunit 2
VRFRPADEAGDPLDLFPAATTAPDRQAWGEPEPAVRGRVLEIVRPGPLAVVADLGRPGYGHLGVPRSGAADPDHLRLANRLVGNPEDAAGVELTLGGAVLRFSAPPGRGPAWVALTGAPAPVRLDQGPGPGGAGGPAPRPAGDRGLADDSGLGVPFAVPAGATLTVGRPATGVRSYLAVRGGLAVPPVLGSRSRDTLSGLGPAPLRAGDRLPVGGTGACHPIVADVAPAAAVTPGPAELRVVAGPRDDWFTPEARHRLRTAVYQVTRDSNRSGLRLSGPDLPRSRPGELASEGMPLGALQVPPSGQPILFLADHPVTGGYPVIAVVATADIGRAAQLRPGDTVRFRLIPAPVG